MAAGAELIARLRAICGAESRAHPSPRARHVPLRRPHALPADAARRRAPGHGDRGPASRARLLRGGRAVGRARRRHRALRRRAAGRRGRADRARAAAADPLDRPRRRPRRRRARGHQPRDLPGRRADPLLPARSLEPDRLLDRRQRRRELGRRALLQVRLHDQLRDRARGRAQRRHASSSSTATRPATTCSARSSAPRGRSASRREIDAAGRSRARRSSARWSRSSTTPARAGEAVTAIVGAGIVPARSR